MARLARVVIPGVPHHVTQRGNRRQPVFFRPADYQHYLDLLRIQAADYQLHCLAYCLMTNHVHLIVIPTGPTSLRAIAETHRRYTRSINFREGWRGYLWQGRFASFPLDEPHLYRAIRYVERNPVTAGVVARAEDYPWSSARAHVTGQADALLCAHPITRAIEDWVAYLADPDEPLAPAMARHSRTGRPLMTEANLHEAERMSGRMLRPRKVGRKRKKMSIVSPDLNLR